MKHLKTYIVAGALLMGLGSIALVPAVALASPQTDVCSTLGSSSDCSSTPSNGIDLDGVVSAIVNILSMVIGITAVIMIIIAGFRFVTANGDSNAISSARSTIVYACVGLVVVALAQAIVRFVLNKVT